MQLIKKKTNSRRGDTLIEVVLCVTIFSTASVGAMASMTASVNRVQYSLETTSARALMDQQAEAIRFIHSATESLIATGECSIEAGQNAATGNNDRILKCNACYKKTGVVDKQCYDEEKNPTDMIHYSNRADIRADINSKTYLAYIWDRLSTNATKGGLAQNGNEVQEININKCSELYKTITVSSKTYNQLDGNKLNISKNYQAFIINPYVLRREKSVENPDPYKKMQNYYHTILINGRNNPTARDGQDLGRAGVAPSLIKENAGFSPAVTMPQIVYGKSYEHIEEEGNAEDDNLTGNINSFSDDSYKGVRDVQGLWVQAFRMEDGKYIDFRISTCWDSPGSTTSNHLETTVRLSNPFFEVGS